MNSNELTLSIINRDTVSAKRSDGGENNSKKMQFDDLRLATIHIFEDWLSKGKISKSEELEVLGTHLYEGLFYEQGRFFESALLEAQRAKQRLCVRLQFGKDAEELSSLPWEYLYSPTTDNKQGFFLSTDVHLVLARYIPPGSDSSSLLKKDERMRVLIVVSEPAELGPVAAQPVVGAIKDMVEKYQYPIDFSELYKPTIVSFLDQLGKKPHVLHFIGHGRYKREKISEIALLKQDETSVQWCPDKSFAEYFRMVDERPRLVFLHMCQGALSDENGAFTANFAALAPKLILANIQAVVAMQHPIANEAAIAFCRTFYRNLAEGKPIDDAVQAGRMQFLTFDPNVYATRVFGTPVLYMDRSDSIVQPMGTALGGKRAT